MNYNNISARAGVRIWLTQDAAYFLEDNLFQHYFKVSAQGKEMLVQNNGGGFGEIEVYGNTAIILDHDISINPERSIYRFRMLDLGTKKTKTIAKVENVEKFLYLDGNIFALCYEAREDEFVYSIKMISVPDGQISDIATSVFAIGVRNGKATYIEKTGNIFTVYEYSVLEKMSRLVGECSIPLAYGEALLEGVNFTSDYIVMAVRNSEEFTSRIIMYSVETNEVVSRIVDFYVDEMVAFDETAFILGTRDFQSESKFQVNKLYSVNLATVNIEEIVEIMGRPEIFVTSDNDAYILQGGYSKTEHYSTSGKKADPFITQGRGRFSD